jgi:ABC-2 type transport system permease protein
MFLRITTILTPPAWQIVLGVVMTAATVTGVGFIAARIYRVGILMYGKRPTFPEILQ